MRTICDLKLSFSQVVSIHESEVWGTYLGSASQWPYESLLVTPFSNLWQALSWTWSFPLKCADPSPCPKANNNKKNMSFLSLFTAFFLDSFVLCFPFCLSTPVPLPPPWLLDHWSLMTGTSSLRFSWDTFYSNSQEVVIICYVRHRAGGCSRTSETDMAPTPLGYLTFIKEVNLFVFPHLWNRGRKPGYHPMYMSCYC